VSDENYESRIGWPVNTVIILTAIGILAALAFGAALETWPQRWTAIAMSAVSAVAVALTLPDKCLVIRVVAEQDEQDDSGHEVD